MVNQMYARGDEVSRRLPGRFENVAEKVSSGRRPGTTGPNVQRNMPGRVTGVADKVLTGSGRPPVGTMASPKPSSFTLPSQTLSRMGVLSRGGLGGLIAAGGLGLFEIGRQTGFEPEKLGQAAAQVQKSLEEVANEAVEVATELGEPIQDFVGRVVQGYQSQMGESDRLERMMMGGQGRAVSDMDRDRVRIDIPRAFDRIRDEDIQERNLMQQQQLGFAAGGEAFPDLTGDGQVTQADILKGRGVFAEGDEVSRETNEIESALSDIQSVAPEAQVIQQVMTMVMELVQSGASEEEIVAALKQMGLDDEDIQQVMMMLAEQMQGQQDPIQAELSQMS